MGLAEGTRQRGKFSLDKDAHILSLPSDTRSLAPLSRTGQESRAYWLFVAMSTPSPNGVPGHPRRSAMKADGDTSDRTPPSSTYTSSKGGFLILTTLYYIIISTPTRYSRIHTTASFRVQVSYLTPSGVYMCVDASPHPPVCSFGLQSCSNQLVLVRLMAEKRMPNFTFHSQ